MSKDIKKALEHCVEWNCDNCPNREELGSGETVCRGRLLPEVLEYVADLEAKLAESEADKKALISDYESRITKHQELMSWLEHNNEQLKQQLEEKDEEIAYLTKQVKKFNNEAQKYFEYAYCNDFHNQDKISFAIDKLEKVKELMRNIDMPNKPELYNNDMFGAGFDSHYIRVEKLIDNQIEELKKEK